MPMRRIFLILSVCLMALTALATLAQESQAESDGSASKAPAPAAPAPPAPDAPAPPAPAPAPAPAPTEGAPQAENQKLTGIVVSTPANAIVIRDHAGVDVTFHVESTSLLPKDLRVGEKATIVYRTAEGSPPVAVSIAMAPAPKPAEPPAPESAAAPAIVDPDPRKVGRSFEGRGRGLRRRGFDVDSGLGLWRRQAASGPLDISQREGPGPRRRRCDERRRAAARAARGDDGLDLSPGAERRRTGRGSGGGP